jgi:hypothetical protein
MEALDQSNSMDSGQENPTACGSNDAARVGSRSEYARDPPNRYNRANHPASPPTHQQILEATHLL